MKPQTKNICTYVLKFKRVEICSKADYEKAPFRNLVILLLFFTIVHTIAYVIWEKVINLTLT